MSVAFESGAKSSEAKPRYDLIPLEALEREAIRMGEGAVTHGENNYQRGKQDRRYILDRINHMIEHALAYAAGDRSTDHLAAIRCNAGMLIWFEAHSESGEHSSPVQSAACPACSPPQGSASNAGMAEAEAPAFITPHTFVPSVASVSVGQLGFVVAEKMCR